MALSLVTGYKGTAHVRSLDIGSFNTNFLGTDEFVFEKGNEFAYTTVSNTEITIADGDASMQGRYIKLDVDTTESLAIDVGTVGYDRKDIIVFHYEKDSETDLESVVLEVVKGTPATTGNAVDPTITTGNIIEGEALENMMQLYRVNIVDADIDSVEQLFITKAVDIANSAINTYTHIKVGTVHALTGSGDNIKFLSTASYSSGDTFTVNGVEFTATLQNGDELLDTYFASGYVVQAFISGTSLNFRSGGNSCSFKVVAQSTEPTVEFDARTNLTYTEYEVNTVSTFINSATELGILLNQDTDDDAYAIVASELIDLTNYKSIIFRERHYTTSSRTSTFAFGVSENLNKGTELADYDYDVYYDLIDNVVDVTTSHIIDISDLTGEYYIKFGGNAIDTSLSAYVFFSEITLVPNITYPENSLWLNTSIEPNLKSVVVSEPTSPSDTDIYIANGDGPYTFNGTLVPNVYLTISPTKAYQYDSATPSWTALDMKILKSGIWSAFTVYYYEYGEENTSVTGGINLSGYIPAAGSTYTITKNETNIYMKAIRNSNYWARASLTTANAVDLTDITTLKLKADITRTIDGDSDFNGRIEFGITTAEYISSATIPTFATVLAIETSSTVTTTYELDVSSYTGDYYPLLMLRSSGSTNSYVEATIYEITGE